MTKDKNLEKDSKYISSFLIDLKNRIIVLEDSYSAISDRMEKIDMTYSLVEKCLVKMERIIQMKEGELFD